MFIKLGYVCGDFYMSTDTYHQTLRAWTLWQAPRQLTLIFKPTIGSKNVQRADDNIDS